MTKLKIIAPVLAIASLCMIITIWSITEPQAEESAELPKLLDRPEKVQLDGEWDQVQNHYAAIRKKLNQKPNDSKALIQLVSIYINEARITGEHGHYYPAALKAADRALSVQDLNSDSKFLALLYKAGVQLSLHKFHDALKTGNDALKLNQHNAQVYGVLTDAYVELGQYDRAIEMADKMISIKPDIRSYSRISYLRELHGDVDGAIEAMTYAVKAGTPGAEETAWAMNTVGDLYFKYKSVDQAKLIFEEILQIRPDYPFAVAAIAKCYEKKGMHNEAKQWYLKSIDVIPELGFYTDLAMLHKTKGETAALEDKKKEIMEMIADDVANQHNMNMEFARIYIDLFEDYNKAKEYVDIEFKDRPNNIEVNALYAEIALLKNQIPEAKNYLAKANVTQSKDPYINSLNNQLAQYN